MVQRRLFAEKNCIEKIVFFYFAVLLFPNEMRRIYCEMRGNNVTKSWVTFTTRRHTKRLSIFDLIGSDSNSITYPLCWAFHVIQINRSLLFIQNLAYISVAHTILNLYWTQMTHKILTIFCCYHYWIFFHWKDSF